MTHDRRQGDLFTVPPRLKGFAPYQAPSYPVDTAQAAAASIAPSAATLCAHVLALIRGRGRLGLTCAEIEALTGLSHQTASARLWDLHTRVHIRDSGVRRLTPSGRKAKVWIAATEDTHACRE